MILLRDGVAESISEPRTFTASSQHGDNEKVIYTVRATEGGIDGTASGLAFNLKHYFTGSRMTTQDFKNMFEYNKTYTLTSWGDGPSMYFGLIKDDEVLQYTPVELDPLSSFDSYMRITSELEKRDKSEDNKHYYTIDVEFEAEMVNMNDSSDTIRITEGKVELWVVDFQSN